MTEGLGEGGRDGDVREEGGATDLGEGLVGVGWGVVLCVLDFFVIDEQLRVGWGGQGSRAPPPSLPFPSLTLNNNKHSPPSAQHSHFFVPHSPHPKTPLLHSPSSSSPSPSSRPLSYSV